MHIYITPADDNVEDTLIPDMDNLDSESPFKHRKFKDPSDWVPPLVSNLENFITKNHPDLSDSSTTSPQWRERLSDI